MAREKGTGSLQKEPSGRWTMRICIDGKRLSQSTGTKDRMEAERRLRRFIARNSPEAEDRTLLADVWELYEESPLRRNQRRTTLDGKEQTWNNYVRWMEREFPDIRWLDQVSRKSVERFLAYMRKDHAATTYNNRVCVIREIFRTVLGDDPDRENPWCIARLLPDDCHVRRELTTKEVARLIDCAKKFGREWKLLFQIGIYTGLRLGDCCRLEWKSINLERDIIQLVPHKTEKFAHGRPVTIPIHPELKREFSATLVVDRTGGVMPQIGDMYLRSRPSVSYRLGRIFRAAGIVTSVHVEGRKWKAPEATFHSLRHTFVSLAANAGVPLHIVQSIVGHESTAMTRHYYHENEEILRKAVAAIPALGRKSNHARCPHHTAPGPHPSAPDTKHQAPCTASLTPEMIAELYRIYTVLSGVFGNSPDVHTQPPASEQQVKTDRLSDVKSEEHRNRLSPHREEVDEAAGAVDACDKHADPAQPNIGPTRIIDLL